MYYTYNYKSQKWNCSKDDIFFPLFIPFSLQQNKAWCPTHKQWETCNKNSIGKIYFQCGIPLQSPLVPINKWTLSKIEVIPIFTRNSVKIRADFIYTWLDGTARRYNYAYKILNLCMKTGSIVPYESDEWLENYSIDFPASVTNDIQEYLSKYAEKLLGKKIKNSSQKTGIDALNDFVICPACPQLADLQNFLGTEYNSIIDRKNLNPYQEVCNYIHIKPFKRMRRIFDNNPLALPIYGVLKYWGFSDVNVITPFLEDTELCNTYFQNIKYDNKTKRIVVVDRTVYSSFFYFRNDFANDAVTIINRWCTESLTIQSEKLTMNKLMKAMKDGYHTFFDAAQMYYSRGTAIPDTLKKRIKKECFSREIHDALVEAFPKTYKAPVNNEVIPYLDKDKILNAVLKDNQNTNYEFILPVDTNALYDLGTKMHNCVGLAYRQKALSRKSLIVGVKENGVYRACIEINTMLGTIVQALGICNKPLSPHMEIMIKKWSRERNIGWYVNE